MVLVALLYCCYPRNYYLDDSHLTIHTRRFLLTRNRYFADNQTYQPASPKNQVSCQACMLYVTTSDLHLITPGNQMFEFADDIDPVIPDSWPDPTNVDRKIGGRNNLSINREMTFELVYFNVKVKPRTTRIHTRLLDIERVSSLKVFDRSYAHREIFNNKPRLGKNIFSQTVLSSLGMDGQLHSIRLQGNRHREANVAPSWWGSQMPAPSNGLSQSYTKRSIKAML